MPELVRPNFLIGSLVAGAGGGSRGEGVNAVNFDGTNDWLSKATDLTGNADAIDLLVSVWFKMDAGADGAKVVFAMSNGGKVRFQLDAAHKLNIQIFNPADTAIWVWLGGLTFTTILNLGWHHALISCQLAATPLIHQYIDDAIEVGASSTGPAAGTIDWTRADWGIGSNSAGSVARITGDIAEVYLTNEFLDLSVEANRRKFIDASGKPVDLGVDGSTPTGTAPLIFLSGDTDAWHTNKGSGGGFVENGALTDAATSPSG